MSVVEKGSCDRSIVIGRPATAELNVPPNNQLVMCAEAPLATPPKASVMSPVGNPAPTLLGTIKASDQVEPSSVDT